MAKRFIDTDLFRKPSFRKLPTQYKILWAYVLCECNHAGIWNVELDVAGLRIGVEIPNDAPSILADMIHVFDDGKKWWIKDFVRFQYGAEMVTGNRMHLSVMRELEKHGLMELLEDISIVEVGTTVSAMRSRLSKKAKNAILLRDELTCQYCQEQKPMAELVVDHVHPVIKGGDNADGNLVACCVRCNGHKTDMDLQDFLAKNHPFLNPTERVNKILEGAFKPLQGLKDKDKDKDKEKDKDTTQKRKEPAKVRATLEERKVGFMAACKDVVDADPARLPEKLRSGFFEYWTEISQDGKSMRFEDEKHFGHARRMATWKANALKHGDLVPEGWNPRS